MNGLQPGSAGDGPMIALPVGSLGVDRSTEDSRKRDAERKRKARQAMSEEARESARKREAERKRKARMTMPDDIREAARKKDAERKRKARQAMTDDERKAEAERKRKARAMMTEEAKKAEADRKRKQRKSLSEPKMTLPQPIDVQPLVNTATGIIMPTEVVETKAPIQSKEPDMLNNDAMISVVMPSSPSSLSGKRKTRGGRKDGEGKEKKKDGKRSKNKDGKKKSKKDHSPLDDVHQAEIVKE